MKVGLLALLVTLWTGLVYSALFLLGRLQIDPIVLVSSRLPDFFRHGMPKVSPTGIAAWLVVLGVYAAGSIMLTARFFDLWDRRRLLAGFLILFFLSAAFVALVHPTLLLTILGPGDRECYSRFIRANVPFLDQIYFHWGLQRQKYLVVMLQSLIALAVLIPLRLTRK